MTTPLIKPAIRRITVDYRSVTNGQFDVAIALDKSALRKIGERITNFPKPVRTFLLTLPAEASTL